MRNGIASTGSVPYRKTSRALRVNARPIARREMRRHPFAGKYVVVKVGGTADVARGRVPQDVKQLVVAGARVVIAHGGGDALTEWLKERGRQSRWIDGLRVTDAATRDDAVLIYRGQVAPAVIAQFVAAGVSAMGIGGVDGGVVRVRQRAPELGYVGNVRSIDVGVLDTLTGAGCVPVVSPLGLGPHGEIYNVNGDDVAAGLAQAVSAQALVFLTDVAGVRDADGQVISELLAAQARALIRSGVIGGGMVPKVKASLRLLGRVGAVWITDGSQPHALRNALVDHRAGTRIIP